MVRLLRAGAVSAVAALLVASAPLASGHAQGGGAGVTTGAQTTQGQEEQRDGDGFDPGWFGLLGLLGLFGLRQRRDEPRPFDTTATTRRP